MSQPKVKLNSYTWVDSQRLAAIRDQRRLEGLSAHVSPFSCLVAAMGQHWHPGCQEAVFEMARHTAGEGYAVTFYEEQDRCYQPYDGLGLMRNLAYMKALQEGYEYLLYVDNDIRPGPEVLLRLMRRQLPIVSPIVTYADGLDHGLNLPKMERHRGLAMVRSVVLSCLLFKVAVFLPWAPVPFWENALGADEEYHFQRLAMAGHHPFVDTDLVVECQSPPHFPLDRSVDRSRESLSDWNRTFG